MPHYDDKQALELFKSKAVESMADLAKIRKGIEASVPSWANEYPMDVIDKMEKIDNAIKVMSILVDALGKAEMIFDPDAKAKQKFLDHREKFGGLCESVTWEDLSAGIKHYYRNLG